jgi:O-acetyl-ADP-ribose deacetylase (regulator of RNase III)
MDGGLDGQLSSFFGESLERRVRERINNEFHGELPVGLAITVDTGLETYQRVICAPTMRCPSEVPRSINAYLAMKAILNEAKRHAVSMQIAVPGLCSLTGAMSASQVARQMRIAYERVVVGLYPYTHWREEREFESFVRGEISQPPIDLQPYLRPYRP